jgi:hypothetical protein
MDDGEESSAIAAQAGSMGLVGDPDSLALTAPVLIQAADRVFEGSAVLQIMEKEDSDVSVILSVTGNGTSGNVVAFGQPLQPSMLARLAAGTAVILPGNAFVSLGPDGSEPLGILRSMRADQVEGHTKLELEFDHFPQTSPPVSEVLVVRGQLSVECLVRGPGADGRMLVDASLRTEFCRRTAQNGRIADLAPDLLL